MLDESTEVVFTTTRPTSSSTRPETEEARALAAAAVAAWIEFLFYRWWRKYVRVCQSM